EMAPKAKCFVLSPESFKVYSHSTGHYVDDLAARLLQLAGHVVFEPPEAFLSFQELKLDGIYNLVSIRHSTWYRGNSFNRLVRRNASTLESLFIGILDAEEAASLIRDAGG
ncbi:hypothetical protein IWW37_006178, partial [Coemansia sp. RSA 2050]